MYLYWFPFVCITQPWMMSPRQFFWIHCPLGTLWIWHLPSSTQVPVPVRSKCTPDVLESVNRFTLSSGPVTKEIVPLELCIRGHQEFLCFDLIHSSHFSIILGTLWLSLQNPNILWGAEGIPIWFQFLQVDVFLGPQITAQIMWGASAVEHPMQSAEGMKPAPPEIASLPD